jgi:Na+/proline symporter
MKTKIIITIILIAFFGLAVFFSKHDDDERYRRVSDNLAKIILIGMSAVIIISAIVMAVMLLRR